MSNVMQRKYAFIILGLLILVSPAFAQTEISFKNEFAEEYYPVWQRGSTYLLEVAEAMPAEMYGYQPSEEVFTFGEQLMHIAANLYYLNATYISGMEPEDLDLDISDKSKEEIISNLREALAQVDMSYQALEPGEEDEKLMLFNRIEADKKRVFMLMRDHVTHHRGQLVVYLRLTGILPPNYVGW
jgi:uncharacterized damage-inducible protein DinB